MVDNAVDNSPSPNCWTPKEEQLLIKWAEKAAGFRWIHDHARQHYKTTTNYFTYPCIIISSITGVGGFAVLNPTDDGQTSAETRRAIMYLQYLFAFLNVIAGILTSLSKYNNSARKMEAHSLMCVKYSKYYRSIDMELSFDCEHRSPANEFVRRARDEYDVLLDESPDVPGHSIKAFNEEFPNYKNKPDVCNGLSIILPENDHVPIKTSRLIRGWLTKRKKLNSSPDLTSV